MNKQLFLDHLQCKACRRTKNKHAKYEDAPFTVGLHEFMLSDFDKGRVSMLHLLDKTDVIAF